MIEALAQELANEIRQSREYEAYAAAREKVLANEQTAALLKRFRRLRMTVQARQLSGVDPGAEGEELKKLAELLQFSPDAAEYLMAEYGLDRLLTAAYDAVAKGVGVDFTEWEK